MKYIHIYIHTHFFLKAFFYTHTHTHTHTHILKGIFMLYIHIYIRLERHFHATYPHIFVRHLPCCSKFKCQSKKPHKYVLIFMHFYIQHQKTQIPKSKSCFWHFILASINCPHTQISQYHTQKPLRHFTEHLVGACSNMKKMRNGGKVTCPFISKLKIGPWPSPTAPQPKHFSKHRQLEH